MPKSWIDSLASSARAVYPHVRRGVRESLSIASIGTAARRGGLSISNANLSAMVKKEREIQSYVKNLTFLGMDRTPNPARLPQAMTRISKKYSIEAVIYSDYDATGNREKKHITITSDSLLSRRDIADSIDDIWESHGSKYGFEMSGFEITGYMRAGSEGFGF